MIEIQFNMKNSILLAFLATDFCSGLQLFRLDNTFLLAFIAPSNFLTETISMRVTHITGPPAHNEICTLFYLKIELLGRKMTKKWLIFKGFTGPITHFFGKATLKTNPTHLLNFVFGPVKKISWLNSAK